MKRLHHRLLWTTFALALALPATGILFPVLASGEPEVRLYTNEDLERFPVLPDSTVSAAAPDGDEWPVVVDYLEREYSRIDADRAYELERNQSEAEVELIRGEVGRRRYSLPYGAWGFGRVSRHAGGKSGHGKPGPIRPLHAGPSRAQIDYYKATRRSGADAFPQRSRPAGGSTPLPAPRRSKGR